jgi:hypothetical protein
VTDPSRATARAIEFFVVDLVRPDVPVAALRERCTEAAVAALALAAGDDLTGAIPAGLNYMPATED